MEAEASDNHVEQRDVSVEGNELTREGTKGGTNERKGDCFADDESRVSLLSRFERRALMEWRDYEEDDEMKNKLRSQMSEWIELVEEVRTISG